MKNLQFILALCCAQALFADTQTFVDLVTKSKIQIKADGLGGHSGEVPKVQVKNNTKSSIRDTLDAGIIFVCEDNKAQSLMVMDNYAFNLPPYSSTNIVVYANCVIPHNYSPHKDSKFIIDTVKNEKLSGLAKLIAKHRYYTYATQSIVWALINNSDVSCEKRDSAVAWPVYQYMAKFVKVQVYKPEADPYSQASINHGPPPKPKFAFASRVNITANIQNTQNFSLICTDTSGKELRSYYKNKTIKNGVYSVTIGFNELVEDTNLVVIFKLLDQQNHIVFSKRVKNNNLDDRPKIWLYKTQFEYDVPKDLKNASLKAYGPDGNLFEVLYEKRVMPKGPRRAPYSFYHFFDKDAKFKIKLFEDNEEILRFDIKPLTLDEIKN